MAAYKELYPDIVEYHANTVVSKIDLDKKTITTQTHKDDKSETKVFNFAEANIMPPTSRVRL